MKKKAAKTAMRKVAPMKGKTAPSKKVGQSTMTLSTFLTTLSNEEPSLTPSQIKMFAAYASGEIPLSVVSVAFDDCSNPEDPDNYVVPVVKKETLDKHIKAITQAFDAIEKEPGKLEQGLKKGLQECLIADLEKKLEDREFELLSLEKVYNMNREVIDTLKEKLAKCDETANRYKKALQEIAKDFGTDYCDGNCVIAREALGEE